MNEEYYIDIEQAHNLLGQAITGLKYDPSWARPQRLTQKERNEKAQQSLRLIERVLGDRNSAFFPFKDPLVVDEKIVFDLKGD
jgi:hypothetical protein